MEAGATASQPGAAGPASEAAGEAEPRAPRDGARGPGASVAEAFSANRVAHPSAPAFGQVSWNAHEPVATYAAYTDGEDWRFRLESLGLDVPVGVNSGGKTDVSGPNSAVVREGTWEDIADDLEPAGGSPNRSPRSTYWARDLTWKHEIFHFDEFNDFLCASFRVFESTIEGDGYKEPRRDGDSEADALSRKQGDLHARLIAAWNQAKTNMAPGMEERAYDDGVDAYQARADAVRQRASDEGWT